MQNLRYLFGFIALTGTALTILFASLWSGELNRAGRERLDRVQTDVMALVSGATCEFDETSDDILLAVLYYAPSDATFEWQMSVPGIGVVWEHQETTTGELFYTSSSRGVNFPARPDFYRTLPNTPIRIEASAYYGSNTTARPASISMIEFDCTTGAVIESLFTQDVAE